jgi:hypothetical protein
MSGLFNVMDVANTLWSYATMGREPGEGLIRELEGGTEALAGPTSSRHRTWQTQCGSIQLWDWSPGGVDGGSGEHFQIAECGKHDVGGCDYGVGARAWDDEGAGGTGRVGDRHVQHTGSGQHGVGIYDNGARVRGGDDEGAGGADGGSGGHVHYTERGQHAISVCDDGAGARGRSPSLAGLAPVVEHVTTVVKVKQVGLGGAHQPEIFKHVAQFSTDCLNMVTLLKSACVITGRFAT